MEKSDGQRINATALRREDNGFADLQFYPQGSVRGSKIVDKPLNLLGFSPLRARRTFPLE